MISYWEHQSFLHYQYIIVGSGIVGLSTALSLKEKDPEASVLILERSLFPSGASTKNAGFACFGSLSELLDDIKIMGEEATVQLVADRWKGLQLLRRRLGDNTLGYVNCGGYELLFDEDMKALDSLDAVNRLLRPVFNDKVFLEDAGAARRFGLNVNRIKSVIRNPWEAQLDTGKMMKSLLGMAREKGVEILTGAQVISFQEAGDGIEVKTSGMTHGFRSEKLGICTNAFTTPLLPELPLEPGRGMVLVTHPISQLKIDGVFHYEKGYYYFRNVAGRVLFGGGRNLDLQGERTDQLQVNPAILEHLKRELKDLILPGIDHSIDQVWTGIMAFGPDKTPLLGLHSPAVGYAVRLGGMGVALGSLLGEALAGLLCLKNEIS